VPPALGLLPFFQTPILLTNLRPLFFFVRTTSRFPLGLSFLCKPPHSPLRITTETFNFKLPRAYFRPFTGPTKVLGMKKFPTFPTLFYKIENSAPLPFLQLSLYRVSLCPLLFRITNKGYFTLYCKRNFGLSPKATHPNLFLRVLFLYLTLPPLSVLKYSCTHGHE